MFNEERISRFRCSRRDVLRAMVASAALVAIAAACRRVEPTPEAISTPPTEVPVSEPEPTPEAVSASSTATSAPEAEPTEGGPKPGGVLRLVMGSDPRWFDPARQMEWWSWGALYDSLLRYTPDLQLYPHLAKEYEIAPDGKSISLKLHQGVKFHSGREFTADDVEWMIELIKEPSAGALFRTFALSITAIEKPDKYSIILKMDKPDAGLLDLLANLYIPDRERIDVIEREGHGTGPFRFVEFRPGEHIILERNEEYWGQKAYLDRIEVKNIGDAQAAVANLEAGTANFVGVPLEEYVRLKDDPRFKGATLVGATGITNVWLNTKREPFDDVRVRQAINYAIDRERFVRTVTMGESRPLKQPQAHYHWAHFPELEDRYSFDLEKAKSLITEAGYPDGFSTTINAVSGDAVSEGLAQIIQSDLAKIGVTAEINAMDNPSWAQASDRGDFDINMHNYGRNNADPTLLYKGTVAWRPELNPTGFDDPKYLELIEAQASVLDREKRKPLIKELVEYVQEMSFVIPVAGGVAAHLYDRRINGFELIPVGTVAYTEKIYFAEE